MTADTFILETPYFAAVGADPDHVVAHHIFIFFHALRTNHKTALAVPRIWNRSTAQMALELLFIDFLAPGAARSCVNHFYTSHQL
jgi:hypothetical protein